jgi:glutathione S-transferase
MKLYYSPGACSLSPHIVLREAGLAFTPVMASTKTHKLADGTDYYGINPKGYVPLLELDDGQRLAEGPAIVQYIADLHRHRDPQELQPAVRARHARGNQDCGARTHPVAP